MFRVRQLRCRLVAAFLAAAMLHGGIAAAPSFSARPVEAIRGPSHDLVLADPATAVRVSALVVERRDFQPRTLPLATRLTTLAALDARRVLLQSRASLVPTPPRPHRCVTREDNDPPA